MVWGPQVSKTLTRSSLLFNSLKRGSLLKLDGVRQSEKGNCYNWATVSEVPKSRDTVGGHSLVWLGTGRVLGTLME